MSNIFSPQKYVFISSSFLLMMGAGQWHSICMSLKWKACTFLTWPPEHNKKPPRTTHKKDREGAPHPPGPLFFLSLLLLGSGSALSF